MRFLWMTIGIITCGVIVLVVYIRREMKSEKETPIMLIHHKIVYKDTSRKIQEQRQTP